MFAEQQQLNHSALCKTKDMRPSHLSLSAEYVKQYFLNGAKIYQ